MDFAEFRKMLEALPEGKGEELINFHMSQVDSERQRGIAETSKRNKENESLRKFKLAFENLGYQPEQDLTEFTMDLKSEKEQVQTKDVTLKDLQSQFQKLNTDFQKTQSELTTERQAATELKSKAKREKIRGSMVETLRDRVYGHDFLINDLIGSGKVDLDETEKVVFVKEDQTMIPMEDGIKQLLESRPDIVKNAQKPGASSQPSGGSPSPDSDQARLERLRKMQSGGINI